MTVEAVPLASDERGPTATDQAILPDPARRHLGQMLAETYGQTEVVTDTAGRFADLLTKLDHAFREAREIADVAFRSDLLAQVSALGRFAVSLTHDPTAADDLVQDTLLRAWRSRSAFAPGTNLQAWTFTILRNQFYTDRRKLGREIRDEDGARAAQLTVVPEQAGHLDLADVRAALGRLSPEMREALMLVTVSGLSYERAALVIGCQLGTVKSRVNRARQKLAKALGFDGAEVGNDPLTLAAMDART